MIPDIVIRRARKGIGAENSPKGFMRTQLHRPMFYSLRRPVFILQRRRPQLSNVRFYSASLPPSEYHRVADETMDKLTSELENLLEENDLSGSDIECSVPCSFPVRYVINAE